MFDETCQNSGETEKSQGHPLSCMEKVGVADQQKERPKKSQMLSSKGTKSRTLTQLTKIILH